MEERRAAGRPSLPELGNPSPQPQSCLEEERDVNKPSTALSFELGLTRPLLPALTVVPRTAVCQPGQCPLWDRGRVWGRMWGRHSRRVPGRVARDTGFLQKALGYCRKSAVGSRLAKPRVSGFCAQCWGWQQIGQHVPWRVVTLLAYPRGPKAFEFALKGSPELVAVSTVQAAFLPAWFPAVLQNGHKQQQALPCLKQGAH